VDQIQTAPNDFVLHFLLALQVNPGSKILKAIAIIGIVMVFISNDGFGQGATPERGQMTEDQRRIANVEKEIRQLEEGWTVSFNGFFYRPKYYPATPRSGMQQSDLLIMIQRNEGSLEFILESGLQAKCERINQLKKSINQYESDQCSSINRRVEKLEANNLWAKSQLKTPGTEESEVVARESDHSDLDRELLGLMSGQEIDDKQLGESRKPKGADDFLTRTESAADQDFLADLDSDASGSGDFLADMGGQPSNDFLADMDSDSMASDDFLHVASLQRKEEIALKQKQEEERNRLIQEQRRREAETRRVASEREQQLEREYASRQYEDYEEYEEPDIAGSFAKAFVQGMNEGAEEIRQLADEIELENRQIAERREYERQLAEHQREINQSDREANAEFARQQEELERKNKLELQRQQEEFARQDAEQKTSQHRSLTLAGGVDNIGMDPARVNEANNNFSQQSVEPDRFNTGCLHIDPMTGKRTVMGTEPDGSCRELPDESSSANDYSYNSASGGGPGSSNSPYPGPGNVETNPRGDGGQSSGGNGDGELSDQNKEPQQQDPKYVYISKNGISVKNGEWFNEETAQSQLEHGSSNRLYEYCRENYNGPPRGIVLQSIHVESRKRTMDGATEYMMSAKAMAYCLVQKHNSMYDSIDWCRVEQPGLPGCAVHQVY
jgi:hypothetical protein